MDHLISIPFRDTSFSAYFHSPQEGTHPGILLIHEVWGLKDHIKNVADRFVQEGYTVLAPDLLSQTGITDKIDQSIMEDVANPATRDEAQKKMREAMTPLHSPEFGTETVEKLEACLTYLLSDGRTNGNVGVVGFCFGGTYTYSLAVSDTRLKAAVPFYGHAPEPLSNLEKISCPMLAFYGEKDENLMQQVPQVEEKMEEYEKNFRVVLYPNTGHAFFNDTNPTTYNEDAASDAWAKTLAFLEEYLQNE